MLTTTRRLPRARRLLGLILLAGLAGAFAVATVGWLRGARSMHVRPMGDVIGAEPARSGMGTKYAAFDAGLDGIGHP